MASLVLWQIKEVGAVTQNEINTECKILTYISLTLTIFGLVMVAILHYRKSKSFRGCMFSNTVKIIIFISDVQYYVPIKLCKTTGMLKSDNVKLNKNYIWDTSEIGLEGSQHDNMAYNSNKINLPRIVMIKLRDKIRIRCMMKKEPLLFHIMLKQGITWFTLACSTQETVSDNVDTFPNGLCSYATM